MSDFTNILVMSIMGHVALTQGDPPWAVSLVVGSTLLGFKRIPVLFIMGHVAVTQGIRPGLCF